MAYTGSVTYAIKRFVSVVLVSNLKDIQCNIIIADMGVKIKSPGMPKMWTQMP